MKLLFTGRGTSGSWLIRAVQLAEAMGASAVPHASAEGFDVVVMVKRAPPETLLRVQAARVPLVWDIVDAWPQPLGNGWDRGECMRWLRDKLNEIRPTAVVAATKVMAEDVLELLPTMQVLTLPHHYWPAMRRVPVRTDRREGGALLQLGYSGGPQHLGAWGRWLTEVAPVAGYQFRVIEGIDLAELDVVVALRELNGYAPRAWKSNVKLANAQAAGLPIICGTEAGYRETSSGAECWADTRGGVLGWLAMLRSPAMRQDIGDRMAAAAPSIGAIARLYSEWLRGLAHA